MTKPGMAVCSIDNKNDQQNLLELVRLLVLEKTRRKLEQKKPKKIAIEGRVRLSHAGIIGHIREKAEACAFRREI